MKRIIPIFTWLTALLIIAIALLYFESDLLWKVQQYNLFLDTPLFFHERMVVSGGFLSYISCFFTQFFYHPWLGVIVLCSWWLLLMWLIKRTFRIVDDWVLLTLIPVAILLIANMCLGYWHYFMRLRGYFFVATIGTTATVAMLWAFRKAAPDVLSKESGRLWFRIGIILVTAVVGYPLFGVYAMAAVLLMGIWIWRLSRNYTHNAILSVVALLSNIAVPLFCYRYVYHETYFGDIWTTGIPAFVVKESYPRYYIPYYILLAYFFLLVVFYQKKPSTKWQKPLYKWSLQVVLVVVLIAGVWHFWYKDENFHHELAMQRCIEVADWEGVLQESQKQVDEPTRAISMMHDIALWRLGRLTDETYSFPRGKQKANTPMPFNTMYHVFGRMIYYQYGLVNDCHRMCMEDGVEYGWRVELQQYMARCSVLCGEKKAARKIMNQLQHTMYYGKWADALLEKMEHPKQIAEDREMGPITHMLHYNNALGFDEGNVENYVMTLLARQNSYDPYFQEQSVLATLRKRNIQQFWPRFSFYVRLHPHGPIPRIFQEAAYLFGNINNMPNIDKLPIESGVKKNYEAFMNEAMKYNGQSVQMGRAALHPFYGNTYFYDYYFGLRH